MAKLLSDIFAAGIQRNPDGTIKGLDPVVGNTPFGFYDLDPSFQTDASRVVAYVASRLGVNGALSQATKITELNVYAAFEEAVGMYAQQIYQNKIANHYINLEGTKTSPFINADINTTVSDITYPIQWSNTLSASLIPNISSFNPDITSLINQGQSVFLVSSSISNYINPNTAFVKDFSFATQNIALNVPEGTSGSQPYGTVVSGSYVNIGYCITGSYNLGNLVYNNYTFVGGPTIVFTPQSGSTSYYKIESGSGYVYFAINNNIVDNLIKNPFVFSGSTTVQYYGDIKTIYYQNVNQYSLNGKPLSATLGNIIQLADDYSAQADSGNVPLESGNLPLIPNQQVYDMDAWAMASASLAPGDRIQIRKVYYQAQPAILRYFDPFVETGYDFTNFLNIFGFGSFSPSVQYQLWPVSYDTARLQAITLSDDVRRSQFSFRISDNKMWVYPPPTPDSVPGNIWFEYYKLSDAINPVQRGNTDPTQMEVSDISNVPYVNIVYSNIAPNPGRQWIFKYALAVCMEVEASIRLTFNQSFSSGLPILPNGSDLASIAKSEKDRLIKELNTLLDQTGRSKQLELKQKETELMQKTQNAIPLDIYFF